MANDSKSPAKKADDSTSKIECNPFLQGIRVKGQRISTRDECDGPGRNSGDRGRRGRHTVGYVEHLNTYVVNPLCYDLEGCAATAALLNFLIKLKVHKR